MRNLSAGAAVELNGGDTLRLRVWSPTGEQVYHDLSPAEADAIRETLAAHAAAPETKPAASSARRK